MNPAEMTIAIVKAILHDRATRRRWLGVSTLILLGIFALGLWGIDAWLTRQPMRFLIYWVGCAVFAFYIMIFALLDALLAYKEVKNMDRNEQNR